MDPLFCNWDEARFLIFSDNVFDPIVYYSHIISMVASLAIGVFVFSKNKKDPLNIALFLLTLSFSIWVYFDLILWATEKHEYSMFFWSIMAPLELIFYFSAFYLVYRFIYKKDVSFLIKILMGIASVPVIFLCSTRYNLENFLLTDCDRNATEGILWSYVYFVEMMIIIVIISVSIIGYLKSTVESKKKIMFFSLGTFLLLITFSFGNFLIMLDVDWRFEQYKLFGMPVFVGFLSYSIIRFKIFNVKLIGVQALVASLLILIASQFTFVQNDTNRILVSVTLLLAGIFGYNLIRNVKREVEQKEELSNANQEIENRKNQLQKISDYLSDANAKLKELDNAKTEFVSIVAHQLQSPPTTIKGYAMLLSDGTYGELAPDQKEILQKIYSANEQQVAFVDDLLSVSRLESGRVTFDFEKCQVAEICKNITESLSMKAKDKNLYLEFNVEGENIPEVNVDKNKMREAITNLVDNAIKYTKKGGVRINLKICSLNDKCLPGKHLRIMISDTGIGIPADEIPRLFTKFSRGKNVKRLNASGTGLGLYVVKKIVEGNKGKVWVESDGDGRGSKFIVELPV